MCRGERFLCVTRTGACRCGYCYGATSVLNPPLRCRPGPYGQEEMALQRGQAFDRGGGSATVKSRSERTSALNWPPKAGATPADGGPKVGASLPGSLARERGGTSFRKEVCPAVAL